jgi:hypothetical protein
VHSEPESPEFACLLHCSIVPGFVAWVLRAKDYLCSCQTFMLYVHASSGGALSMSVQEGVYTELQSGSGGCPAV